MDDAFLARFRERSAYEAGRDGPPTGSPSCPTSRSAATPIPRSRRSRTSSCSGGCGSTPPTTASCRQPGSYRLCHVGGAPILLVRGEDGAVRAFRNACRHRGAPVVRGECGTARLLVCQFHSWSYDLSGAARAGARRAGLRRPADRRARPAAGALRAVGWLVLRQLRRRRRAAARSGSTRSPACSRSWRRRRCG